MEIISIHVGQAGVQIGSSCWELYCKEHGILPDGQQSDAPNSGSQSYLPGCPAPIFSETSCGKYVPRTVLVDLEPTVIEGVQSGVYRDLFSPQTFVTGKEDASSLYSQGYYYLGKQKIDEASEAIRKQVEQCEHFQGFMIFSSLGGGTGSGFTSLLGERLSVSYKHCKTKMHVTVFPSPTLSPVIVEPYNGVLGVSRGLDHTDSNVFFDNESLYNVCTRHLDIERPTYSNLNDIISQVTASITASTRFEGGINTDLNTIQTNTVPYPRVKFLMATYAPLISPEKASYEPLTVSDMTKTCFDHSAKTLSMDLNVGNIISSCILYRGLITAGEINSAISDLKCQKSLRFTKWVPSPIKVGQVHQPPTHDGYEMASVQQAVCTLTNHCAQETLWDRLNRKFDLLYSKRAYLHWYHSYGMEKNEFACAREELAAVEKDYYYENNDSWGCSGCYHRFCEDSEDESEDSGDD